MTDQSRVELIMDTVDDLVSNFLYYDRKEDELLPRGSIGAAIDAGELSTRDIAERFQVTLIDSLARGEGA